LPSGKIHTALTLSVLSGVLAPYAIVQLDMNPWMYGAGVLVGVLISPDLDVDKGNVSDSLIRRVSRPAQWAWRLAWQPYAWSVPHRHTISHFPFLGTLLRLWYIFLIVNILNGIVYLFKVDSVSFIFLWDWSFFFGLAHADIIHWIADNTIKGQETFGNE
jgi:uncharacterized metal-binding protein